MCNLGRRLGGQWYGHPEVGWNLRLTEIQAALLLPWLDRLDAEIDRREAFVSALDFGDLPVSVVPQPPGTTRDSRHLLMLRVHQPFDRDFLLRAMAAEGVPLDGGYPPLGTMTALTDAGARAEECPATAGAARDVVWMRQSMLMDDPVRAGDLTEALRKVLS